MKINSRVCDIPDAQVSEVVEWRQHGGWRRDERKAEQSREELEVFISIQCGEVRSRLGPGGQIGRSSQHKQHN